ncbi:hypothetical protein [uncultured Psychroserpens sp.]|uniref:hypothetical protein n=1 Tax=uncultured Psychroserpens sp. TaxID=255436 RepID=UPI00262497E9|nr:hypothetical protein [uncultured Psychroserpens sp.]
MAVSEQKKLVIYFYLISLVLNVVLPYVISKVVIGDETGEIQILYVGVIVWGVISLLIYGIYFLIPEFQSKRDKISAFMLPSMIAFGACFIWLGFFYLLLYTLSINLMFVWIWYRKFSWR